MSAQRRALELEPEERFAESACLTFTHESHQLVQSKSQVHGSKQALTSTVVSEQMSQTPRCLLDGPCQPPNLGSVPLVLSILLYIGGHLGTYQARSTSFCHLHWSIRQNPHRFRPLCHTNDAAEQGTVVAQIARVVMKVFRVVEDLSRASRAPLSGKTCVFSVGRNIEPST